MIEDFDCGECEENLRNLKPSLFAFHGKLAELAKNVEWPESKKKAYEVLSEICGLYFCPDDADDPLRPLWTLSNGRRSFSIEDLTEEELSFLETIVDSFQSAKLRARIADVLWLRRRKKAYEFGMKAIDAYLEVPLSPDNWKKEEIDGQWTRGSILALKLGKANESFHGKRIEEHLFDRFSAAPVEEWAYLLFLADLLERFRVSGSWKQQIAAKLDDAFRHLANNNDHCTRRTILEVEKRWGSDPMKLQSRIAKSFEEEIQSLLPKLDGQHLRVQVLCNQLIESLRVIPEKQRAEYDVDNRLKQAQSVLVRCREHTTEDFHILKSKTIDLSELIDQTKRKFHGLNLEEALLLFADIYSQKEEDIRAEAQKLINENPIVYLFGRYNISEDGRIVSKTSGLVSSPKSSDDSSQNVIVLEKAMIDAYDRHIQLCVKGILYPAYSIINEEHRFTFSDAVSIVRQSPLIPPNRHLAFGKALDFGFHGDFFTALYILVPEIENVIRFHLKGFGVKTTTINEKGIEQEVGMSSLMDNPEVAQCLGKDFAWELKALFCDQKGRNLRNNYAHGLETDKLGQSIYAFYAWWLIFRMIMLLRRADEKPPA